LINCVGVFYLLVIQVGIEAKVCDKDLGLKGWLVAGPNNAKNLDSAEHNDLKGIQVQV